MRGGVTVSVTAVLVLVVAPAVADTTQRYCDPLSAGVVRPVSTNVLLVAFGMSEKTPDPEAALCQR
jgi:hypothetical protein